MVNRSRFLGAIAAIFGLFACAPKENVVKIAIAMPLTGDMGTEGQGIRRAVELAVEQANASKRFPFKIVAESFDDRADPKEAVNVANLITSDPRIVAVVGHYNSGCAIPAAKVYARGPVAMITPAATNPEVTAQQLTPDWVGPRVVYRVVPTDDVQGAYVASYAYTKLGKRRMALLHDKTPYGQGLAEQFRKSFVSYGGAIVSEDGISVGDKDFKALLTKINGMQPRPQGLYFGGLYTEAGLLLKQMKELGMSQTISFMSSDGSKTSGLFDVAGDAADGAYLSIVGVPVEVLPTARHFVSDYRARWTKPGEDLKPFDHFGYDAVQIIFAALERAGVPDRVRIIDELKKTSYSGLVGETKFDEKGDTMSKIVTITRARARDRSFPTLD